VSVGPDIIEKSIMWTKKLQNFVKQDGLTVGIILLIVGAYIFLRTPNDGFDSMTELERQLQSGIPSIVEFYSNTCSICLTSKPAIDQLEKDLAGQAQILRLDVKDKVGGTLAAQWGVRGVPTFFILDGQGNKLYTHIGKPDLEMLKQAVTGQITP